MRLTQINFRSQISEEPQIAFIITVAPQTQTSDYKLDRAFLG